MEKNCKTCKYRFGDLTLRCAQCAWTDEFDFWERPDISPDLCCGITDSVVSQGEKRVSEGMQELKIYQYQAKRIEDAFRIVSNHFHSQHKKTCLDRDITWCWQTIKNILEGKINERVERF